MQASTSHSVNRTLLPYLGKQIRDLEELASDLSLHDTATRLAKLILRHVDHENQQQQQQELKLINDLSNEEMIRSLPYALVMKKLGRL